MGLFTNGKAKADVQQQQRQLGGTRAALFVYAMEGLENMAFVSNAVSLVTYFYGYMNFGLTKSATTLTNFMGTSFLVALFGGFISDTYLSRFKTCVLFGCLELVGYTLLAVQAHFPSLRPDPCKGVTTSQHCAPAEGGQAALLFAGLYMVALGTSGVKAALPSLGADQFDETDPQLSSFFNWFLFSLTLGSSVGVTLVVWISANQGWDWGFGLCAVSVLSAVAFVSMGRSFYRHNVPGSRGSPVTRVLQVFVVAARNWRRPVPDDAGELHEVDDKEAGGAGATELLQRTDQFRFLDRAAAAVIPGERDGAWRVCTVTQVEETKILLRMLPIILSTVFMNVCLAQLQTFTVQQGTTLDTRIAGGFRVPAASLPVIPLVFMTALIPLYDRAFVPLMRRLTGIPTGIRHLQRIGVGLVLSAASMAVAAVVERRRKAVAVRQGMVDSRASLPMSVFWLAYQYGIFGAADMFTLVGLLEFFYAESSAGMKSMSTAISWSSLGLGYYGSSVAVTVVNRVSGGWLAGNNLNRDRLDYFYWLLAGVSVVNFGVYLLCALWYRYKKVDSQPLSLGKKKGQDDGANAAH